MTDDLPGEPTVPPQQLPWPDDKENELATAHYAVIGRVAAEWSAFEATIVLQITNINAKIGVCLTSQINGSGRKLDAYVALARLLGAEKQLAKLNTFAKDTLSFAERRNRIVHDPWVGLNTPHRLEATARRKLRFEFISVPTEDVQRLSFEITEHCVRFERLHDEILADVIALLETQPPTFP
jgi:hypothetical protein